MFKLKSPNNAFWKYLCDTSCPWSIFVIRYVQHQNEALKCPLLNRVCFEQNHLKGLLSPHLAYIEGLDLRAEGCQTPTEILRLWKFSYLESWNHFFYIELFLSERWLLANGNGRLLGINKESMAPVNPSRSWGTHWSLEYLDKLWTSNAKGVCRHSFLG